MEVKCPTCGNAVLWEETATRPFCSERCQLIDFGAWADEEYRVPLEGDQSEAGARTEDDEDETG